MDKVGRFRHNMVCVKDEQLSDKWILDIRRVWNDWTANTTLNGVVDIGQANYGLLWKVAWISCLVLLTGLSAANIHGIVYDYFDHPTMQEYVIQAATMLRLPDVVICNDQLFDAVKLKEMGASDNLIKNLVPISTMLNQVLPRNTHQDLSEYEAFRVRNQNITYDRLMHVAGFDCPALVHGCDNLHTKCCDSSRPVVHSLFGRCHRFAARANQTWPGIGAGINMLLKCPRTIVSRKPVSGVIVEFVYPGQPMSFSYFTIPANVLATVHLEEQHLLRINLKRRGRTCNEEERSPQQMQSVNSDLISTTNGCFYAMHAEAEMHFCNCTMIAGTAFPLCEMDRSCALIKEKEITKLGTLLQSVKCLPQCKTRRYKVSLSFANLDMAAYGGFDLPAEDRERNGYIMLDVFHPIMETHKITETPLLTSSTLISNIGGALGLWLGVSVVTLLQALMYCFKCTSICIGRRKSQKIFVYNADTATPPDFVVVKS